MCSAHTSTEKKSFVCKREECGESCRTGLSRCFKHARDLSAYDVDNLFQTNCRLEQWLEHGKRNDLVNSKLISCVCRRTDRGIMPTSFSVASNWAGGVCGDGGWRVGVTEGRVARRGRSHTVHNTLLPGFITVQLRHCHSERGGKQERCRIHSDTDLRFDRNYMAQEMKMHGFNFFRHICINKGNTGGWVTCDGGRLRRFLKAHWDSTGQAWAFTTHAQHSLDIIHSGAAHTLPRRQRMTGEAG